MINNRNPKCEAHKTHNMNGISLLPEIQARRFFSVTQVNLSYILAKKVALHGVEISFGTKMAIGLVPMVERMTLMIFVVYLWTGEFVDVC